MKAIVPNGLPHFAGRFRILDLAEEVGDEEVLVLISLDQLIELGIGVPCLWPLVVGVRHSQSHDFGTLLQADLPEGLQ